MTTKKEEILSVAIYFTVMGFYLYGFYGFGARITELLK